MSETQRTAIHPQASETRDAVIDLLDQAKRARRTMGALLDEHETPETVAAYEAMQIAEEKMKDALGYVQKVVDRATPSPWEGV